MCHALPSLHQHPPPPPHSTPVSLAVRWPQHSSNQQITTVTLMSEIAYEGNLFPMVGQMINAHWQRVFPPGALLGRSSCVTPPPSRCATPPPPLDIPQGEGWSGDATEGLRWATHDNSLLSADPYFCIFIRRLNKRKNAPETLKVSKLAKTSRQKCLKIIWFTHLN